MNTDTTGVCADIEPLIAASITGALSPADAVTVADHLAQCDRCFVTAVTIREAAAEAAAATSAAVPAHSGPNATHDTAGGRRRATTGQVAILDGDHAGSASRRTWFLAGMAAGMAACVAIAVVAGMFLRPLGAPSEQAARLGDGHERPIGFGDSGAQPAAAALRPSDVVAVAPRDDGDKALPSDAAGRPTAPESPLMPHDDGVYRYQLLAQMQAPCANVAIFAQWSATTGELIAVTVHSSIAKAHSWTAARATKIAKWLKRSGRKHKWWRSPADNDGKRLKYVLSQHRGRPGLVTVKVGGNRLQAEWPQPHSQ